MRRHRLMGIDPAALDAAMQERQEQHRAALDQLRARLSAAEGRLGDLRARKEGLSVELSRLGAEAQSLLQEMDQVGQQAERPRQALAERHRRIEEGMREGLALLEQERDGWIDLERQIAEGVMAALQPYLDLTSLLPDPEGGGPDG